MTEDGMAFFKLGEASIKGVSAFTSYWSLVGISGCLPVLFSLVMSIIDLFVCLYRTPRVHYIHNEAICRPKLSGFPPQSNAFKRRLPSRCRIFALAPTGIGVARTESAFLSFNYSQRGGEGAKWAHPPPNAHSLVGDEGYAQWIGSSARAFLCPSPVVERIETLCPDKAAYSKSLI